MGQETRGTRKLQVKILWGKVVLPTWGSAGAAGYDLSVVGSCVMPSWCKGIVDTGLAGPLRVAAYAQIAPCLGLSIWNFIDVRAGVVVELGKWE